MRPAGPAPPARRDAPFRPGLDPANGKCGGSGRRDFGSARPLAKAGLQLAREAAQVGRTGTPELVKQTVDVIVA